MDEYLQCLVTQGIDNNGSKFDNKPKS